MRAKKSIFTVAVFLVGFTLGGILFANAPTQAADKATRVFELRTYVTNEGKLDDLHARFRDHTTRLFKKHGMDVIGYWVPVEGDEAKNTLVYLLGHKNADAAEASWEAFGDDPDWRKAYKASVADGGLVDDVESVFLNPTDYSPMK